RDIDDTALAVNRHAGPVVCCPYPCILMDGVRPGVVAQFAGPGNRLKHPCQFSGDNVECLNVSRRGVGTFREAQRHDDQVFMARSRGSGLDVRCLSSFAKPSIRAWFPAIAKRHYGLSSHGLWCAEPFASRIKNSFVVAILPAGNPPYDHAASCGLRYPKEFRSC